MQSESPAQRAQPAPSADEVIIRPFDPASAADHEAWREIALEWLTGYQHGAGPIPYLLEKEDFHTLDRPVQEVIVPGGQIWMAQLGQPPRDRIVGTIALYRHGDAWEVIKLGVRPMAQGRGIGDKLVSVLVEHARARGDIQRLLLDSNSHLHTAIRLYEKHGFRHVPLSESRQFATADVAMELILVSPDTR